MNESAICIMLHYGICASLFLQECLIIYKTLPLLDSTVIACLRDWWQHMNRWCGHRCRGSYVTPVHLC